MMKERK